jgi:membrane-associated phospholipid phosphatase
MSRRPPPAAGRAVPTGLGVVAAVALGSGAMLRDRVEWYDAYVDVLVSGLHARFPVHDARMLSNAGPYLGVAMVIVALFVATRRGARPLEVLRPLAALTLALLCVEFLKLAVFRDRPFSGGPAQHDSFPSGDTAQVALCAATALHLVALRRIARDWVGLGMVAVGATTAVAIALARIYLGRHWLSDVAASLLIGLVFWSAAPRWPVSMRKVALVVAGIVVIVMSGPPLMLPSPMAFDDQLNFELPVPAAGPRRDGGRASWRFRTAEAEYSLLQLELVPRSDDATAPWLDVELDRDRVVRVPLAAHRRIYALPLPHLASGLHEVDVQERQGGEYPALRSFTLARASIEGAVGNAVVRESADGLSAPGSRSARRPPRALPR